jgi:nucleoid-associated protein YgaU
MQLLARATRASVVVRAADLVSPRVIRSLIAGAASVSMSASLSLPAAAGPGAGEPTGTAVMVPLDVPSPTSSSTTSAVEPAPAPDRPVASRPAPAPPAAPAPIPVTDDEIVVEPGDSFWSIAAEAAAGGDVDEYWRSLIEANRDRLIDRDNPDLLYPGQVLTLP